MSEYDLAMARHKKRKQKKETMKEDLKLSKIFSKVLLSIIFVLASTIYIKLSDQNKEFFKTHLFENNLAFTQVNSWYHNTFGNILPSVQEPNVSYVGNMNEIETKERYLDGYKITTQKNTPITAISGGLFIYMGEKEGYENTYIIQGVDGVDIWYGNITDTDLKLYDYVDAGTILGVSEDDYYYIVMESGGKYLTYEEYDSKVSS